MSQFVRNIGEVESIAAHACCGTVRLKPGNCTEDFTNYLKKEMVVLKTAIDTLGSLIKTAADLKAKGKKHGSTRSAWLITMLANTGMPMFLTSCKTEMHIWKYG